MTTEVLAPSTTITDDTTDAPSAVADVPAPSTPLPAITARERLGALVNRFKSLSKSNKNQSAELQDSPVKEKTVRWWTRRRQPVVADDGDKKGANKAAVPRAVKIFAAKIASLFKVQKKKSSSEESKSDVIDAEEKSGESGSDAEQAAVVSAVEAQEQADEVKAQESEDQFEEAAEAISVDASADNTEAAVVDSAVVELASAQ